MSRKNDYTAKSEAAMRFYAQGKIKGWNGGACLPVRVLIHKTWWTLTDALVAELEAKTA